jgi:superfamily II DNA or RNA helicase
MILFDECQMLGAQTLQDINKHSTSATIKLGTSATPHRDSGDGLLIEGAVGNVIINVPASELIAGGFLVKPKINFVNIPESVEELGNNYQSIYKKYVVENEIRNNKIVEIANKLKDAGRKTLILVKNIKHGEALLDKFDDNTTIYFVRGELDSGARNRIKKSFMAGEIDIIIASAVYDTGIDIPNLDALILAGSGKSSVRALQRIGRVIRNSPGKKDAVIVDFIDNAKYLYNHSMRRLEIYKTEDGFEVKMPKDFGNNTPKQVKLKPSVKKDMGGW